ncbi:MAG: SpoIIIAH-like family protein [Lachnospiraceae bacterium]|nr:SpoIIIAH-like family protein [Lachnospiraceae bacterium]
MKKLIRKNQFIITLIAVLIVVAGYLNYSEKIIPESKKQTKVTYDDDLLEGDGDILSMDIEDESETAAPGTAVFTSAGAGMSDFVIQARMDREQIRSKNKEELQKIIDSDEVSEDKKKEVVDVMVKMANYSGLENEIETVLKAKGYKDVVVTLNDKGAEVIVNANQVTDSDRAQIEQVITRKTDIALADIVITPLENK